MSVGNDAAAGINARGPVRMVGMEEQVELRIPYVESYVPAGRRKPKHFAFWSTLPIGVLRVEAGDLTPAYRVIPPERRANAPSYAVGSFRGALWWPVSAGDVAMTPTAFRARAARGDMEIVGMLGAETFRSVYESRESFHAEFPYGKTVADTREQQWTRAQRGATERILFCGDEVLLDAGEPIHYFGSYADFVGPAFSNRHVKLRPGTATANGSPIAERHTASKRSRRGAPAASLSTPGEDWSASKSWSSGTGSTVRLSLARGRWSGISSGGRCCRPCAEPGFGNGSQAPSPTSMTAT
jgi:hypothetical protein